MIKKFKEKKSNLQKVILISLSVAVLIAIILHSGITNLIIGIKNANIALLLIVFLLLFASNIFRVKRWQVLLDRLGINFSFKKLLTIFLGIFFIYQFSPQVGGDFYRTYALHKSIKQSFGLSSASVLYDRLLDMATVLGLSAISFVLLGYSLQLGDNIIFYKYLAMCLLLFIILFIITFIALKPNFGSKLANFGTRISGVFSKKVSSKIKEKFDKNLEPFYTTSKTLRTSKKNLFLGIILSLFAWMVGYFSAYILFMSINVFLNLSIVAIICFLPPIIAALLSIFPRGAARDLTAYGVCLLVGLSPQIAGLYVILNRLLGLLFGITVGWYCFAQTAYKLAEWVKELLYLVLHFKFHYFIFNPLTFSCFLIFYWLLGRFRIFLVNFLQYLSIHIIWHLQTH